MTEDRSYLHRVRCEGGPLNGRSFEFRSPHPAPWSVLVLGPPDGQQWKYMRVTPRSPMRPGDVWEYVPLPAQPPASPEVATTD